MSDHSSQLEHHERQSGGAVWLIVIFLVLPVLYILSPPWVALMMGPNYYDKEFFQILYTPLIVASDYAESINDFYNWYFELVGI